MESTSLGVPQEVSLEAMGRAEVRLRMAGAGGLDRRVSVGRGRTPDDFLPAVGSN